MNTSLSAQTVAILFCRRHKISNFKVHPETGVIDVDGDVNLAFGFQESLFQVQFGKVTGNFDCHCTQLTSLKGAPYFVGGDFDCGSTAISSLEYAPRYVGGSFLCWRTNITSLKGAPREIGGDFVCDNTDLTSLEGLPESIRGHANFTNNNITDYGILDLLYVSNLRYVFFDDEDENERMHGPGPSYGDGPISKILNEAHLSRDIITAQDKLFDIGFATLADYSPEFKAKQKEQSERMISYRPAVNKHSSAKCNTKIEQEG